MVKAQRTRQQPGDIKAADIARLLEQAGWKASQRGSHVTLRKHDEDVITLADPISRNVWAQLERRIGASITSLLTHKRGSAGTSPGEWRRRIQLAGDLHAAGFPSTFIGKYAVTKTLSGFQPSMVQALGVDGVLGRFLKGGKPYKAASEPLVIAETPPIEAPTPKQTAVAVAEREEPAEEVDTINTMLSIISELQADVHSLVTGRAERATAYAERLRRVRRLAESFQVAMHKVTDDVDSLVAELTEN